jgi:regulator of sigma E protease
VAVDGRPVRRFSDLERAIFLGRALDGEGRPISRFTVEREGNIFHFAVPVATASGEGVPGPRLCTLFPAERSIVGEICKRSPAAAAGFRVGDELVACNGAPLHGPKMLQELLEQVPGPVEVELERNGERLRLSVAPRSALLGRAHGVATVDGREYFFVSAGEDRWHEFARPDGSAWSGEELLQKFPGLEISPEVRRPAIGILFAASPVLEHRNPFGLVLENVGTTFHSLGLLFRPHSGVGVGHLVGVPGIARLLHRLSMDDFRRLLALVLALNVGFAVLNLLPIPGLDGGQILFAICRGFFGRHFPLRLLRWAQSLCLLFLFALIIRVSIGDILRWRSDLRHSGRQEFLRAMCVPPQF